MFPTIGLLGAAWALLISRTFIVCLALLVISTRHSQVAFPKLQWPQWRPRWSVMKRIIGISIPASLERIASTSGILALMTLVSTSGDGTAAVSGYTIGIQIQPVFRMVGTGLGLAAAAMVGQNLGAGYPDEAAEGGRSAVRLAFYVLSGVGLATLIFPDAIVGFFTGDAQVVHFSAGYVRALGIASVFMGATYTLAGALRGAGDTPDPHDRHHRWFLVNSNSSRLCTVPLDGTGRLRGVLGSGSGMDNAGDFYRLSVPTR